MNTLSQPRQEWLMETLARLPEQGKAEILNGVIVLMSAHWISSRPRFVPDLPQPP